MNNLVLYRKYRPKTFAEITGQEHVVQTLTNAIANNNISHAYLFTGPRGTGKCVKFDTEITDSISGEVLTVEEAFRRKVINLFTLQDNYRLKRIKPINFVNDGIKPCYKVKTALGKEIEVTSSHPFLTVKGWTKLSELEVGNFIGIPRIFPVFGKKSLAEYKVKLIAHLISEGSTYDWNSSIGFTNSDPILVNDFISAVKNFENIKVKKHDSKGTRTPTYYPVQIIRRNWISKKGVSKNIFVGFAKNLGLVGHKSKDKSIPSIIFQLKKPLVRLFLKTIYSGDGGVDFSSTPTISYYSSSKKLINQIQHLLLRFGIIARTRYKPVFLNNKKFPNWVLEITHRESLYTFIKEIGFIGEKEKKLQGLHKYISNLPSNPNCDVIPLEIWDLVRKEKNRSKRTWVEIGKVLNYKKPKKFSSSLRYRPSRKKLRICGEVFNSKELLNIADSDVYWDKIVKIKYTGKHQVYDLEIPDTHNFIAKDFIVHNTTLGRLLAKAVNCTNRKGSEPCNECDSCIEINQGKAIDLIEIDAASNRGIDEIRDLKEGIIFVPSKSKFKVFIIDESHSLTKEAANALLKTLEEPPSHAIFVLATTEAHRMIATIVSRCQRFDFRKLNLEEIIDRMKQILEKEKKEYEEEALKLIAVSANGSIRDSETLLDQVLSFSGKGGSIKKDMVEKILGIADKQTIFKFLSFIADKKAKQAIGFLNEISFKGTDLQEFIKSLIQYSREMLLLKIDPDIQNPLFLGLSKEEKQEIKALSDKFSDTQLKDMLEKLAAAEQKMKYASIQQLPLELVVVDICRVV